MYIYIYIYIYIYVYIYIQCMLIFISYIVGMLCEYFMNSFITTRKKYSTIILSIFPVWLGLRLISMLCVFLYNCSKDWGLVEVFLLRFVS